MRPFGASSFLINYIVFFALPLASLPSSFPIVFYQVFLSPPINKVYIVSLFPAYCRWFNHAVIRINCWQQGAVLLGCLTFYQHCARTCVIGVELARVPLVVFWMSKFTSGNEMCFFARCIKYDWLSFLLHLHSTRKEVSLGGLSSL